MCLVGVHYVAHVCSLYHVCCAGVVCIVCYVSLVGREGVRACVCMRDYFCVNSLKLKGIEMGLQIKDPPSLA